MHRDRARHAGCKRGHRPAPPLAEGDRVKKTSRTKLMQLDGPTTLADLDDAQLASVAGGVYRPTKWSWSMPQDPDDIFRLDDE
jgi:hypothetical protein